MYEPTVEDRLILETIYYIPSCVDILICPFSIGILAFVKAPDALQTFRRIQMGIITCSMLLTFLQTFFCQVFIYPYTVISMSSRKLAPWDILVMGNIFVFLFLTHFFLQSLIYTHRVISLSPPIKKTFFRRLYKIFAIILLALILVLIGSCDRLLIISIQATPNNSVILHFSFGSIGLNFSTLSLAPIFNSPGVIFFWLGAGMFILLIIGYVITTIILLSKLPHLVSSKSLKTKMMQEQLFRVSIAQGGFFVAFCLLIPILGALSTILLGDRLDRMGWYLSNGFAVMSLHSSGNCFIVLFVTKFYRDFFFIRFQRLKGILKRVQVRESTMVINQTYLNVLPPVRIVFRK